MNGEHLYYDDRMDWILGGDHVHHALVLIEGFDNWQSNAKGAAKGWTLAGTNSWGTGRFGGHQLSIQSGNNGIKNLPSTYFTLIAGVAIQGSSTGVDLFMLRASTTSTVRLQVNATTSRVQILNSGGTIVATGTTTLNTASGAWNYYEIKAFVNAGTPASGTIEVWVNGVQEIASTAANFGTAGITNILINGNPGGGYDDMYVCDTTGSNNNTFLGDVRVTTIFPSADGTHTDFAPSPSGAHFSKVNESVTTYPDDDATYVSDSTVGHLDTYAADDIDGGATVFGVQVNVYARKDDAGVRQIAPVIRQAGTDYVGSTVTLTGSYVFYSQIYNQDPTPANWTASNVNSDEYGVKTIA